MKKFTNNTETKQLIFVPSNSNGDLIAPEPSYRKLPQWYKDLTTYGPSNDLAKLNPVNDRGSDGSNVSTKLCLPFQDAMTLGYMYCLEDDLKVELTKLGKPKMSWNKSLLLVDKRPSVDLAIPRDCHPMQFGIKMNWFYETPKDYSLLITMPINRPDLPFWTPSGIVDSDVWGLPAFLPFFLKRGFEGVIPMGTPISQLIPIKREPWEIVADYSEQALERHNLLSENRRSHITGHYRKFAWRKKFYK